MKQKILLVIIVFTLISFGLSISGCSQEAVEVQPTSKPTEKPVVSTETQPPHEEPTATPLPTVTPTSEPTIEPTQEDFVILSDAFQDGDDIPEVYTCHGDGTSPPLNWSGIPIEAQSLAVFLHDIDAGSDKGASTEAGFVHWIVFNIPPDVSGLDESIPPGAPLENGALQGSNDTAKFVDDQKLVQGYFGPCPPPGPKHQYVFSIYALDTMLDIPMGAEPQEFLAAIENHVLKEAKLIGYYQSKQ